jgi:Ring finger domain
MASVAPTCLEMKILLFRLAELIPDGYPSSHRAEANVLRRAYRELKAGVTTLQTSLQNQIPSTLGADSIQQLATSTGTVWREITRHRAVIILAFCQAVRIFGRDMEAEKLILEHRVSGYLQTVGRLEGTPSTAESTIRDLRTDFDRCTRALDVRERARVPDASEQSLHLRRSLDQREIDRLLPALLRSATSHESSSPQCVICMHEYVPCDEVRYFAPCNHKYHKVCIDLWLMSWTYGPTCPICRVPLQGT